MSVEVVRPADLLVLRFEFWNLRFVGDRWGRRLVRQLDDDPAPLVVPASGSPAAAVSSG